MNELQAEAPFLHVDLPANGVVASPGSTVQGWLSIDGDASFERIELVNRDGLVVPLRAVDRPDVRSARPSQSSIGFIGLIDITTADRGPWAVRYEVRGTVHETPIALQVSAGDRETFASAKARKLSRVRSLLRCPACHAALAGDVPALSCPSGHRFRAGAERFDFLDDGVRKTVGAVPTENVSGHGYDQMLLDVIANSEGPILDAGAGWRPDYRDDVVNLDIVPYPTTDVVAAAEYLPFVDNAFDVVISVAVLEHVRDPFAAARELERVLKPGGRIFAAVPFLQPYHGYPDHYYNMTANGLRNLFKNCAVESLNVPRSGGPVWALTWILQAWREALPPHLARRFDEMRVADLAVDPMTIIDADFVRELPDAVNEKLAALNILIGRKRG